MDVLSKILQVGRAGPCGHQLPPTDEIFKSVAAAVSEQMSSYDASHDMQHVLRVTSIAQAILIAEVSGQPDLKLDPTLVLLAAVLHDISDRKYTDAENPKASLTGILSSAAVPPALSSKVVDFVEHVSYSSEKRDPSKTQFILSQTPELGVVQDADRLDAIGAIGIGRTFTFGGAKMPQSSMQLSKDHIIEKLAKLAEIMKVRTSKESLLLILLESNSSSIFGRRRLGNGWQKNEQIDCFFFSQWWDEEMAMVAL
ncbi:HD domain-containing protein [Penicillium malachiteum]|uniref:HD domain-containing protein n=1 Tax=Penicillium malachiteum TaxID=1324776 RepID=A0AAD6MXB5_9EURO|nr:HD domain-containing protein [Penicillium malachiteum]